MTWASWWQRLWPGPWHVFGRVESADEVPDVLPRHGAVLVGSPKQPKWLAFDCPCGANHRVMISLDRARYPYWRLLNAQHLTLSPSIDDRARGRRCHYLIRNGRVLWV